MVGNCKGIINMNEKLELGGAVNVRQSNFELLRLLCIFGIVTMHMAPFMEQLQV